MPSLHWSVVQAWPSLQSDGRSQGLQLGAMFRPQTPKVQVAVVQASLSSVQSPGVSQGSQAGITNTPQTLP